MEILLIICLVVVLVVRWVYWRDRMAAMESRIRELTARFDAQSQFVGEIYRRGMTAPAAEPEPTPTPAPLEIEPEPQPASSAAAASGSRQAIVRRTLNTGRTLPHS